MDSLTKTQFRRAIPKELQDDIRFVGFKLVPKKNKDGNIELLANGDVKYTKLPINPQTGKMAKSNDSRTWSFLGTTIARQEKFKYDGIGIMLGNGLVGIDLDHVLLDSSPNKANIDNIVKTLNSYTELSPSKTGIHILLRVEDKDKILVSKRTEVNGDSFEFYKSDRFFTLTGNKYKTSDGKTYDSLRTINALELKEILKNTLNLDLEKGYSSQTKNISTEKYKGLNVKDIHMKYLNENYPSIGSQGLSNAKIIEYISKEPDGNKYMQILAGGIIGDQSSIDFNICRKLAFYTDSPRQMNEIIINSGLVRDKWFEQRGNSTYGLNTIFKTIEACKTKFGDKFKTKTNQKELVKERELER